MLPHAQAYAKVNLYFDSSFNIFTVMMKRRIACSLIFLLHTTHRRRKLQWLWWQDWRRQNDAQLRNPRAGGRKRHYAIRRRLIYV